MIFQQKKQSFYFTGGLAPALNVSRQKKQTIWYENGNKSTTVVKDDAPYRLLNVRSAWGIGFEGGLTKRMNYFIQPTFNIAPCIFK
ncbi:MAG TPA: hypothetical protein DCF33_08730, partial [Saprospirales bacterium]|nr:hypothetical protein [Saprospirales bacterium]